MGLPHTFIAGDVAASQEVNDNFNYLMNIIGQLSTEGRIQPLGELLVGARSNTLLTGAQDTGNLSREYYQIGWNADFNLVDTTWKFSRFISNRAATAIRIGSKGFEILGTSETSGDLDSQMSTMFAVRANKTSVNLDYYYMGQNWPIQSYDDVARDKEDFRTLYTPLETPYSIYHNASLSATTRVFRASDFGIPTNAQAIALSVEFKAGGSRANIRFMRERDGRRESEGFVVHAPANEYGSGWGVVNLGTGGYARKFAVKISASISEVDIAVQGYYL